MNCSDYLPEGRSGDWEVRRFSVTPAEAYAYTSVGVRCTPGFHTALNEADRLWMSDMEWEIDSSHLERFHGHVLIAGLGLGLIPMLVKDQCASITVVEKNIDVINLVAPYVPHTKVIHDDIFVYEPDRTYDYIFLDIWPTNDVQYKQEYEILRARYPEATLWEEERVCA